MMEVIPSLLIMASPKAQLLEAIQNTNLVGLVNILMAHPTVIYQKPYQESFLYHAIKKEWIPGIEVLIRFGCRTFHLVDNFTHKRTAIYKSVKRGRNDILRLVLPVDWSLIDHGYKGNTPLHIATIKGNLEAVEILLEAGSHLNPYSGTTTPAHLAIYHQPILMALLQARPWMATVTDSKSGNTLLHLAVQTKNLEICLWLNHNYPSLIEMINTNQETVAHLAVRVNHEGILTHILARCPDLIDARDKYGKTSLSLAVEYGFVKIISMLLKANANIRQSASVSISG